MRKIKYLLIAAVLLYAFTDFFKIVLNIFNVQLIPFKFFEVRLIIGLLCVILIYYASGVWGKGFFGKILSLFLWLPVLWCIEVVWIYLLGNSAVFSDLDINITNWLLWWAFSGFVGGFLVLKNSRFCVDIFQRLFDKWTQRSHDREQSTEEIFKQHDKLVTKPYNPEDYFRTEDGLIFHSLSVKGVPMYSSYDELIKKSHGNSTGKSQMGKNVAIQALVVQLLLFDELIVMCDSKGGGDDVMPPILKRYADKYNKPYNYIELSLSAPYQFNILQFKDVDFLKATLMQLAKLGETDDMAVGHHIGKDDAIAQKIAFFIANSTEEITIHDIMTTHFTEFFNPDNKEPSTLETALKTAASKQCINAKNGFKISDIIENGGVFYIQTASKDDNTILSVIISAIKFVRTKLMLKRIVTVIADEFMNYCSQDFILYLTEGAGKGTKVITAYQTSALLEIKSIGKTADQMFSVIMGNNNFEYLYGTRDPLVLNAFEEHYCGTRKIHKESKEVETSFALADKMTGQKRVTEEIVARYPKELLTKLRTGEHFLYRAGELLELCYNGYLPLMEGKFDKNADEFVNLLKASRTLTLISDESGAISGNNHDVDISVLDESEEAQTSEKVGYNRFA
jgi:hypothetical protein